MGSDGASKMRRSGRARSSLVFGLLFVAAASLSYLAVVAFRPASSRTAPRDGLAAAAADGRLKALQQGRKAAVMAQAKADLVAAAGGGGELQRTMETRVCGSPAVDGYAHVKPECLEASPTNKWWQQAKPAPDDLDIHIERHADYDGLAVGWGIGNTKASIEECAEACRQHKPKGLSDGPFGNLPCNAFAWCAFDDCFEPDAHKHGKGDCWLKFTEAPASPEVNMRGRLSLAAQKRHPAAPKQVQWHAGVLLPHGVLLRNGSFSPRHDW